MRIDENAHYDRMTQVYNETYQLQVKPKVGNGFHFFDTETQKFHRILQKSSKKEIDGLCPAGCSCYPSDR